MNTSKSIYDQPHTIILFQNKETHLPKLLVKHIQLIKLMDLCTIFLIVQVREWLVLVMDKNMISLNMLNKFLQQTNMISRVFAELNIQEKKGIQFALSREDTWLQGIWVTLTQSTPPPNRYQIPSKVTGRQKFTFGQRTQSLQKFNTPGVYPLSKFQNSGACIVGKIKNDLRHQEPGKYLLGNIGMNSSGIYSKNGMRSVVQQTFSKFIRKGPYEINKVTPGPGRYKMFSEFDQ
ncbi:unnamed protein product [Paramecium pentaurelia]|uniref:Uncharacterized protein n=1 Tax=Paramecium pentaurelia TaxID=43138 RepID=A0A8S1WIA7_9CILI|nr:unnamed protein product [Paramecium pentaurelia]